MKLRFVLLLMLTLALPCHGIAQDKTDKTDPAAGNSGSPADKLGTDAKENKGDFDFPHDGKTDDVNAIGNRNVGCTKGLGNWYSLEGQVRMGKTFAMQVEHSAKVIDDPVISEYINRIAQNIVRNSDAKVPFTVKVLDDGECVCASGRLLLRAERVDSGGRQRSGAGRGDGTRDCARGGLPCGASADTRNPGANCIDSTDFCGRWTGIRNL
jgi:hypothetical protein